MRKWAGQVVVIRTPTRIGSRKGPRARRKGGLSRRRRFPPTALGPKWWFTLRVRGIPPELMGTRKGGTVRRFILLIGFAVIAALGLSATSALASTTTIRCTGTRTGVVWNRDVVVPPGKPCTLYNS